MLIEVITHEHEFKVVLDAVVRHEFGPSVQTFAGKGRDGGVDARFSGVLTDDGVNRRWLFQYKFVGREFEPTTARQRIKGMFVKPDNPADSEFASLTDANYQGYVLLTNAPLNPAVVDALEEYFRTHWPDRTLLVWDRSRLNTMLRGREFLLRASDQRRWEVCHAEVVSKYQSWMYTQARRAQLHDEVPLWPLRLVRRRSHVRHSRFAMSMEPSYYWSMEDELVDLGEPRGHPLFDYAKNIAYPRAFEGVDAIEGVVAAVRNIVLERLKPIQAALHDDTGVLGDFPPEERAEMWKALAFGVLEVAWGIPERGLHTASDGHVSVYGVNVYSGPRAAELTHRLDEMVQKYSQGTLPKEVRDARDGAFEMLWAQASRLWYPAELLMDFEG